MRSVAKFVLMSCMCGKQTIDLIELLKHVEQANRNHGEADASVMTCGECDLPMIMIHENRIYAYHRRVPI